MWWSNEGECRNLGIFNQRLKRKRVRETLKMKSGGEDRARTSLEHAKKIPLGRTSALCDTTTQASNLYLRG